MNINTVRLCLTFAGCFLGAGYVSGQELWQFFASFGIWGFAGLVFSMAFIFLFGVLLMRLAFRSGITECDKLIIRAENKFLRGFIAFSEIFFLLGIVVIMTAGVGALFKQTAGVSEYLTSAIFVVVVLVLAQWGQKGMVSVFSLTVPILVFFTIFIGILSLAKFGLPDLNALKTDASGENPLLSSWWVSAITFVCYNLFSSVQILAPVGAFVNSRRKTYLGVFFGTVLLFIIAAFIFVSMSIFHASSSTPLPMLYVAGVHSRTLEIIYSILLFLGMLGTALSSFVAVNHFIVQKSGRESIRIPVSVVLCVVIYFSSLVGFGDLIGTVYPLCGYLGVLAITALCEHYFHIKKTEKKK